MRTLLFLWLFIFHIKADCTYIGHDALSLIMDYMKGSSHALNYLARTQPITEQQARYIVKAFADYLKKISFHNPEKAQQMSACFFATIRSPINASLLHTECTSIIHNNFPYGLIKKTRFCGWNPSTSRSCVESFIDILIIPAVIFSSFEKSIPIPNKTTFRQCCALLYLSQITEDILEHPLSHNIINNLPKRTLAAFQHNIRLRTAERSCIVCYNWPCILCMVRFSD